MSLMVRLFYLVVTLALLAVIPWVGNYSWGAYQDHVRAQERLSESLAIQGAYQTYAAKVQTYSDFVQSYEKFRQRVSESRVAHGDWDRYQVDLRDELVPVPRMQSILANARHGSGGVNAFYFRPEHFEILSLQSPNPSERVKQILEAQGRAQAQSPVDGAAPRKVVGDAVLLNLKGEYLVFKRL
ncbi:MAG: hypothetical protein H7831_01645 [Magnetococcus sp. WYHC-3]